MFFIASFLVDIVVATLSGSCFIFMHTQFQGGCTTVPLSLTQACAITVIVCFCLLVFVFTESRWPHYSSQMKWVQNDYLMCGWLFFQKFTSVTKWATFSLCDCSHPMITIYHIYKHMVLTECHLLAPLSAHTTISTWANKPPRQKHLILFGCFPTKVGQHVANRGAQSCLAHAALREAPPSLDAVSWLPR
jgi:hypothetical protein